MKHLFPLLSILLAASFTPIANAQDRLYPNEFSLENVSLLSGPFKKAMELNLQVLEQYDADRLMEPYQKQAGIETNNSPFTNWSGLDGHVGGHFLSALAIYYAAEKDSATKNKIGEDIDDLLTLLKNCQDAYTGVMTGYLGGVPNSTNMWKSLAAGNFTIYNSGWVPWYNVHKMYAGLRDIWLYTGKEQAKEMFLALCDWGINITSSLTDAQMETMLGIEHGGMNEIYADAYQITNDSKYLTAAKRFSHKWLLNPMNSKNSSFLDNKHANTQVPKIIGFERISQLDSTATAYANAAKFFWEDVVNNRTLSLGGNSRNEHFISASASEDYVTYREGPESCNTYNMLKLTEDLFSDNPSAKYADFYERALFNHILSTQHPEHGGYVYFTPARPRHYRVYSAVNQAMWCCVGSGMENHGKYGQFIYSHFNDSLYVNLFIASELNWEDKSVSIRQETNFPYEEATQLTVSAAQATEFEILIRHPYWVSKEDFFISVNGEKVNSESEPSSYVSLKRSWNDKDVIRVSLPMKNHYEEMPNVSSYIAFMHGPILLGAKTEATDLDGLVAGEGRMDQVAGGALYALNKAPILIGDRSKLLESIETIDTLSLTFRIKGGFNKSEYESLILQPFYTIHDSRYMMYWMQLTEKEYQSITDELEAEEEAKLQLDNRTIDKVSTGEQQPESDHFMEGSNSYSGVYGGEYYRDARQGGWFSYKMLTDKRTDLTLQARYWGNESGSRSFDILIDGQIIATENVSGQWKIDDFVNVEYNIPTAILENKDTITVKFAAHTGNAAGGVYYLRLMKPIEVTITDSIKLDSIRIAETIYEEAHNMQVFNSVTGSHQGLNWRDAENGGFFGYTLKSGGLTGLYLRVRYWGNEGLNRKFYIVVENDTIATENIVGKWNTNAFKYVNYTIPNELVRNKQVISVLFDAAAGNYAGGVFGLWLMRDPTKSNIANTIAQSPTPYIISRDGHIEVTAPQNEQYARIMLFSLHGDNVYAGNLINGKLTFSTEQLSKGLYIISYSYDKTCYTTKIRVL